MRQSPPRGRSGKAFFQNVCAGNKVLAITRVAQNRVSGSTSLEWLLKSLERDPRDATTYSYLGFAQLHQHKVVESTNAFLKAVELFKDTPQSEADLGASYALSGHDKEALAIAERLIRDSQTVYVPPYTIASIYAGLKKPDETFRWLDLAVQDRAHQLIYIRVDPIFDSLREDRRFNDLMQRIGFPTAPRTGSTDDRP